MALNNLLGMNSSGQAIIGGPNDYAAVPAIIGSGAAPTITMGSAGGTGGTASIVGTNLSGKITVVTGTALLTTGKVLTLTFANGFTFPGGCVCVFTAGDGNFASVITKLYAVTGTSSIDLNTLLGLSINTTYTGYYTVTGW